MVLGAALGRALVLGVLDRLAGAVEGTGLGLVALRSGVEDAAGDL